MTTTATHRSLALQSGRAALAIVGVYMVAVVSQILWQTPSAWLARIADKRDLTGQWEACALSDGVLSQGPTGLYLHGSPLGSECTWKSVAVPGAIPLSDLHTERGWVLYRTKLPSPSFCSETTPCSLVITEIGDAALVTLGGQVLGTHGGLPPNDRYADHYPLAISIPPTLLSTSGSPLEVNVLVRYLKRAQTGILRGPVAITRTEDAFRISRRTLAHTVIVPLIFGLGALILALLTLLGVIFSSARNARMSAYLRYCAASALFLISYTCLPREVLPLALTGCAHFMLRFLMDWSFFELALRITGWRPEIRTSVRSIYAVALVVFLFQFVLDQGVFAQNSSAQAWIGFTGAVHWSRYIDFFLIFGAYLYGAIASYANRKRLSAAIVAAFGVTSLLALSGCLTFHGVVSLPHFVIFYPFFVSLIVGVELWSGYLAEHARSREDAIVGLVTRKIVHNLKSPVTSLSHLIDSTPEIPAEKRRQMRENCTRMDDMVNTIIPTASTLLETTQREPLSRGLSGHGTTSVKGQRKPIHLASLLEIVASTVRLGSAKDRNPIDLDLSEGISVFVAIDGLEFKQVMSNLLENAVEASQPGQPIGVTVRHERSVVIVSVRDYGCGVPKEHRSRLGEKGFTFGKKSGTGLGLFSATSAIKEAGGRIEISFPNGSGTEVDVVIPAAPTPGWFTVEPKIEAGSRCAVLDDEPGISEIWRSKCLEVGCDLVRLRTVDEARRWLKGKLLPSDVLLFDYDLDDEGSTGLDLLEGCPEHRLRYLVTNHADEPEIVARAQRAGIRVIPKSCLAYVCLETEDAIGGPLQAPSATCTNPSPIVDIFQSDIRLPVPPAGG